MTDEAFLDALFPVPPVEEQATIVRFLDHVDRRIRRYIRAKEKLIALLEEQKKAIIHQAVTGKIDVRTGQPYPSYKNSGSLLREYRSRLIADVVTGKLDVREAAAELPKVDPVAEDDLDSTIHDRENSKLGELDAEESALEYTIEKEMPS